MSRSSLTPWQKGILLAAEWIGRMFFAVAFVYAAVGTAFGNPLPTRIIVILAASSTTLVAVAAIARDFRWLFDTMIWALTLGCLGLVAVIGRIYFEAHATGLGQRKILLIALAGLIVGVTYLQRKARQSYRPPPPPKTVTKADLLATVEAIDGHVTLHTCASTYVVLGGLICGPAALAGIAAVAEGQVWAAGAAFAGAVWLLAWLVAFRIEATADIVAFRRLFGGTTTLPYQELAEARIEVGFDTAHRTTSGMYRLVLLPRPESGYARMEINIKVFSEAGLKQLLLHLLAHARPDTRFDARCLAMAGGQMPSVLSS